MHSLFCFLEVADARPLVNSTVLFIFSQPFSPLGFYILSILPWVAGDFQMQAYSLCFL